MMPIHTANTGWHTTLYLWSYNNILYRLRGYLMKVILSLPDEGYYKSIWWRLFWVYLMKVILSLPDEGYFESTWWRLFWVYLMKVILSLPDEGYFESTWWRLFWVYLMKVILSLPDEGYFEFTWWRLFWIYLMKVILSLPDEGYFESTWWSLFQKLILHTKFDIYIFITEIDKKMFIFFAITLLFLNTLEVYQTFLKLIFTI
jgi:hypothetical protein